MNFLAIPTLKNDRACLRLPISIRPLRSLKVTFESERTGIVSVGSLRRSAAWITTSATPISFFSTAVAVRCFWAMGASYLLLRAVGLAFARALVVLLRRERLAPFAPAPAPLGGGPPFVLAAPFGDPAVAATSATGAGTSPSTPSGVTMIECGRPSGPLPF